MCDITWSKMYHIEALVVLVLMTCSHMGKFGVVPSYPRAHDNSLDS